MGSFFSAYNRPSTTVKSDQQWIELKLILIAAWTLEMRLVRSRAPQSSERGVVVRCIGLTFVFAVSSFTAARPCESSVRMYTQAA